MRALGIQLTLTFLVLMLAPTAMAQEEAPLLDFEMRTPSGVFVEMDPSSRYGELELVLRDVSRDGVPPPELGLGNGPGQPHVYTFQIDPRFPSESWNVVITPPQVTMQPGEQREVRVQFTTDGQGDAYYPVAVNVTARPLYTGGEKSGVVNFLAHMEGARALSARVQSGFTSQVVGPDETVVFPVQLENLALETRIVGWRVTSNSCNVDVASSSIVLPPRQVVDSQITVQSPSGRIWYFSESCNVVIAAEATDGSARKTLTLSMKVNGGYFDPQWLINVFWLAVPAALIIWFVVSRKRRVEEEILGKPQPPWTVPSEQVYLAELEKKDPRAAYVVRNFLMEDEYRSALDWYHSYKRATRGERAKERVVIAQEKKLEKWDEKQAKKVAKPARKSNKYSLKLQKKLDRKSRKTYRKAMRKWRKTCKKLDAKNAKVFEKLHGVWEKQQRRAIKKGTAVPPEPQLDAVDYPPEPERVEQDLVDHSWANKAIKFQSRMEARTERMQASYDRARERRLKAIKKRLQRIANKLDDPAFVDEHPLLKSSAGP